MVVITHQDRQHCVEVTNTFPNLSKLTQQMYSLQILNIHTVLTEGLYISSYSRSQDDGSFILIGASMISEALETGGHVMNCQQAHCYFQM